MPKLRLMHMLGAAQAGGAETFFIRLMASLAKHPEVELMPVVREKSWASEQLTAHGVKHVTAPFGGIVDHAFTKATARRMARHAREFQPHVIQAWMNRAASYVPPGPWVKTARVGGYYDMKYYRGHVDDIIVITQDLKEHCVRNGWKRDHVTWINSFAPTPPEGWAGTRDAVRKNYGIPPDATALLIAGRLHKVKGVDLTLRAVAPLGDKVWVIAAGNGPDEQALKALAAELGIAHRVVFTGWVNDISVPAAAADIWLVPSRWEPMGNTTLDAWAYGKPLIAARAAGPASMIEDGKTGLLAEVDDVETLRAAIKRVIDDPALARALADEGHRHCLATYGEDVIINTYLNYYRHLIAA